MTDVQRESTELHCVNGDCEDGIIVMKTTTEVLISNSEIRMGGDPPPMRHVVTFYCDSCGISYESDVILRKLHPAP